MVAIILENKLTNNLCTMWIRNRNLLSQWFRATIQQTMRLKLMILMTFTNRQRNKVPSKHIPQYKFVLEIFYHNSFWQQINFSPIRFLLVLPPHKKRIWKIWPIFASLYCVFIFASMYPNCWPGGFRRKKS